MSDPPKSTEEIEITPEMIEAGVYEARGHPIGGRLEDLVEAVYIAMITEHDQVRSEASEIIRTKCGKAASPTPSG